MHIAEDCPVAKKTVGRPEHPKEEIQHPIPSRIQASPAAGYTTQSNHNRTNCRSEPLLQVAIQSDNSTSHLGRNWSNPDREFGGVGGFGVKPLPLPTPRYPACSNPTVSGLLYPRPTGQEDPYHPINSKNKRAQQFEHSFDAHRTFVDLQRAGSFYGAETRAFGI